MKTAKLVHKYSTASVQFGYQRQISKPYCLTQTAAKIKTGTLAFPLFLQDSEGIKKATELQNEAYFISLC